MAPAYAGIFHRADIFISPTGIVGIQMGSAISTGFPPVIATTTGYPEQFKMKSKIKMLN